MTGLCGRFLEGRDPLRGCRSDAAGHGSRWSRGRPRPVPAPGRCHASRPRPHAEHLRGLPHGMSTSLPSVAIPGTAPAGCHHALSRSAGRGARGCGASPQGAGEPLQVHVRGVRARHPGGQRWGTSILTRGQPDMGLSQQRCREAVAARGPSPPAGADPAPIGAGGSAQAWHPDHRSPPGEASDGALRSFRTLPASLPVARPTSHVRPTRAASRLELIDIRNSGSSGRTHRFVRH